MPLLPLSLSSLLLLRLSFSLRPLAPEYTSWKTLESLHSSKSASLVLKDLFAADPKRFSTYQQLYKASTEKGEDVEIFLDYSKNLIDEDVWKALISLAKEAGKCFSALIVVLL